MLCKTRILLFVLMINLINLSFINAMQINSEKMAELSHESADFQALLASVHYNPTAGYIKALMDDSLDKTAKQEILDKLKYYRAAITIADLLYRLILKEGDIDRAFLFVAGSLTCDCLKVVVDLVSDINIIIPGYSPALVVASTLDKIKLLIEYGADVNIQDDRGLTALIAASRNGSKDKVELLLNAGADPDIQTKESFRFPFWHCPFSIGKGYTALMTAASWNNKEICKLLVEAGANRSITNEEGQNAIDIARSCGNRDIAEYLEKAFNKNIYTSFVKTIARIKYKQKKISYSKR